VRHIVEEHLTQLTPERVMTDAMGNLTAHFPGQGPRVAIMAHMDEVGFYVSKIESGGFLRVLPAGGVDPRVFWAQTVVVHGREDLLGVVGSVPPHLSPSGGEGAQKVVPIEECFIDLGLPEGKVVDVVAIGDPVTFATRGWETETALFAKALDDRVGLFIMLEAVREAERVGCDLYMVASTQEEYGLRGAGPAVYAIEAEIVLALEGTVAMDTPGLELPSNLTPTAQGKGPEIRLTDKRMVSDRRLADFLIETAEASGIPHQLIVKKAGTTDASEAQVTGRGVRACALSVPTRYLHAPTAMVLKADVHHAISLVREFLENADRLAG
jgi:endoglucanase